MSSTIPRLRSPIRPFVLAVTMLLSSASVTAAEPADWLLPPFRAGAEQPALRPGSAAPTLEWQTPDGGRGSLEDFRGEVVVVVFWASWCPWCRRWWPVLTALSANHAARPRIVPINVWDDAEAARLYVGRGGFPWPLRRADDAAAERWQARATPHSVVVDAAGRVSGVVSGFDPDGRALARALDLALAASPRQTPAP